MRKEIRTEKDLQTAIVKEVKAGGGMTLNKIGNFMEGSGWPDVFVWSPVIHCMLEIKGSKTPFRKGQINKMRDLVKRQMPCFVVRVLVEDVVCWSNFDEKGAVVSTGPTVPVPRGFALLMFLRGITEEYYGKEFLKHRRGE